MNIVEALQQSKQRNHLQAGAKCITGSISQGTSEDQIHVYPDPNDPSAYVRMAHSDIDGEVVDVTEEFKKAFPGLRQAMFSIPVRVGATITLIAERPVKITSELNVGALALRQDAPSGCSCSGGKQTRDHCWRENCRGLNGNYWPCKNQMGDSVYCSNCCVA